MERSYKNNEFKIKSLAWSEEFELPDGSYSISNIQDYFEYILKNHGSKTVNSLIKIYINKIKKRITSKIKTGHYLELLTPETIKLLESTKSKVTKDENGEYVPNLEILEVLLVNLIIVNYNYKQKSRVLYASVTN